MLYSQLIGIIEFTLRIPQYLTAIVGLVLSFRTFSLRAIYKISPIIAVQLLVNTVTIVIFAPLDVAINPFLLLRWFSMSNVIIKTILMITVVSKALVIFRDLVAIGFFIHRTYWLLHPLQMRKTSYVIAALIFAITFGLSTAFLVPYFGVLDQIDGIREDCFYTSCVTGPYDVGRKTVVVTMVTISIITVISGCVFVIVLQKKVTPAADKKINRVLKYEFLFRCAFETFPFLADVISSSLFKFSIGYYLGAYSTQFISMDMAIFTVVYYRMLKKHNHTTTVNVSRIKADFSGGSVQNATPPFTANTSKVQE
ncbi:hypothetical protein QR680_010969 [Steinernema hermaphroditum]|uniref:Uncharacterized protein n=1 Tax=Steinernema hermaphroditum TaxID=289476 RepID=A0AA39IQP0_9BILA|nr:hypothetical protein QR680_010969 [Steinernema hermaphroditum]